MMNMFKQFLKKLNLTEMIYMNWLEIYHVMMMKELYDISVLFLRCLRNLKKWSWLGKIGKNGVKNGVKKSVPKSANIHYWQIKLAFSLIVCLGNLKLFCER